MIEKKIEMTNQMPMIQMNTANHCDAVFYHFNPLTAGAAYIRVFIFISTLTTTI